MVVSPQGQKAPDISADAGSTPAASTNQDFGGLSHGTFYGGVTASTEMVGTDRATTRMLWPTVVANATGDTVNLQ